jgi:hypothetical protein
MLGRAATSLSTRSAPSAASAARPRARPRRHDRAEPRPHLLQREPRRHRARGMMAQGRAGRARAGRSIPRVILKVRTGAERAHRPRPDLRGERLGDPRPVAAPRRRPSSAREDPPLARVGARGARRARPGTRSPSSPAAPPPRRPPAVLDGKGVDHDAPAPGRRGGIARKMKASTGTRTPASRGELGEPAGPRASVSTQRPHAGEHLRGPRVKAHAVEVPRAGRAPPRDAHARVEQDVARRPRARRARRRGRSRCGRRPAGSVRSAARPAPARRSPRGPPRRAPSPDPRGAGISSSSPAPMDPRRACR